MGDEAEKVQEPPVVTAKVVGPKEAGQKQIRSFKDLIKGSWGIFTRVWKKYLVFYLAGVILSSCYILIAFGVDALVSYFESGAQGLDPTVFGDVSVLALVGLLVLIPFSIAIQVATNRTVFTKDDAVAEGVLDTLKYGFKNIIPFFLVSLLFGLMVFGASLLLLIPGIMVALMYGFYSPIFVVEGKRGWAVFKRSAEITKGYKWKILGKYLLLLLVYLLVSFLVGLIGAFIIEIPAIGAILSVLVEQVSVFIITPLLLAYGYLMYEDLAVTN